MKHEPGTRCARSKRAARVRGAGVWATLYTLPGCQWYPSRAAPSPASESRNGLSATFQCTRRKTRVTGARKRQPKPHQTLTRNAPTRKLTDQISPTTPHTTNRGTPAIGDVFRDIAPTGSHHAP